jgi:Flp pilus assembly protein TadG
MVSAELAIALPTLIIVVLASAWVIALLATQSLVGQAAREGARAAARGESPAGVRKAAEQLIEGGQVFVRERGGEVRVTVVVQRSPSVGFLAPFSKEISASAMSWRERP